MADKPKPKEPQTDSKTVAQIIEILALILLLGALASAIFNYFDNLQFNDLGIVSYFLEYIWPIWKWVAVAVAIASVYGIHHSLKRLRAIWVMEKPMYNPVVSVAPLDGGPVVEDKNDRWEQIIKYSNSDNSSDWKQAIIEADVMLDELLRNLGYMGDSLGEMLKSVDKSDFLSLEEAWEAHKVRNMVAHSGSNFQLTQRETKRVISLFEKVFTEFDMI